MAKAGQKKRSQKECGKNKNGKSRTEKTVAKGMREEEKGQEIAVAEIRTTQATYQNPPDLLPYRDGCPECKAFPLVTEQKIRTYRVCRCRECGWHGEMVG